MRQLILIAALFIATQVQAQSLIHDDQLVLSRYTTQSLEPSQADIDPLAVVVQINFPQAVVHTVGDAIRYLLLRTGYSLQNLDTMDAEVTNIMTKPLPESHRHLGAYRVTTLLQLLLGTPFELHIDTATRTIAYSLPSDSAKTSSIVSAPQNNLLKGESK